MLLLTRIVSHKLGSTLLPALCRPLSKHVKYYSTEPTLLDISNKIQAKPKLSGAGPFPAPPRFDILGSPPSLLYISLPASAPVYARRGTVIACSPSLEYVNSTLGMANVEPHRHPLAFQRIVSSEPVTVLLSASSKYPTSYMSIDLKGKEEKWQVTQRKSLLAWAGQGLNVEPSTISRDVTVSGSGQLALIGEGDLYSVELSSSEKLRISTGNLLAYSGDQSYRLVKTQHSNNRFEMPRLSSRLNLRNLPGIEKLTQMSWVSALRHYTQAPVNILRRLSNWLLTKSRVLSSLYIWKDDIQYEIKGPCTVVLQTRSSPLSDTVSVNDIKKLAEKQ